MAVTKVPKKVVTLIEPKRSMIVDKEKYRQKRVAAYCRVSTDSEEQLVSYANQKKVYTEMIASHKEWCFAGLYADEGKSGTRADKRPEFNKMIKDSRARNKGYVLWRSSFTVWILQKICLQFKREFQRSRQTTSSGM